MAFYTLKFSNYAGAKAAAKQLGFWDDEVDALKVQGISTRPDGTTYGWMIDEIGKDPVEGLTGYIVNIVGELPPGVDQFRIPYGSGGRLFAGSQPEATP